MRTSAHSIKSKGAGSKLRTQPREGTRLRTYFDLAMTGEWFDLTHLTDGQRRGVKDQLRERYELELVRKPSPSSIRQGNSAHQLYKCVGVWVGTDLRSLEDVEVAIIHTQQGE